MKRSSLISVSTQPQIIFLIWIHLIVSGSEAQSLECELSKYSFSTPSRIQTSGGIRCRSSLIHARIANSHHPFLAFLD